MAECPYKTIDEYIASYKPDIQKIMEQFRKTIHQAAPDISEKISWGMATFVYKGKDLVYFAGATKHLGFHPTPSPVVEFADELADFSCSKGSIRFPYDKPIPYDLVKRIVQFRVNEI